MSDCFLTQFFSCTVATKIVKAASNISYRPLVEVVDTDRRFCSSFYEQDKEFDQCCYMKIR